MRSTFFLSLGLFASPLVLAVPYRDSCEKTTTLPTATLTADGSKDGCDGYYTQVYTTTFNGIGPTGITTQAYTLTESCINTICHQDSNPTVPAGFTVTGVVCGVCGETPVTTVLTLPTESLTEYTKSGYIIPAPTGGSGELPSGSEPSEGDNSGSGSGSDSGSGSGSDAGSGSGSGSNSDADSGSGSGSNPGSGSGSGSSGSNSGSGSGSGSYDNGFGSGSGSSGSSGSGSGSESSGSSGSGSGNLPSEPESSEPASPGESGPGGSEPSAPEDGSPEAPNQGETEPDNTKPETPEDGNNESGGEGGEAQPTPVATDSGPAPTSSNPDETPSAVTGSGPSAPQAHFLTVYVGIFALFSAILL